MSIDREAEGSARLLHLQPADGRVADAMADALAAKGYDVTKSAIEFTDPHWSKRFSTVPMRFPALRIPTILVSQRMRKTGEIRVPGGRRRASTTSC